MCLHEVMPLGQAAPCASQEGWGQGELWKYQKSVFCWGPCVLGELGRRSELGTSKRSQRRPALAYMSVSSQPRDETATCKSSTGAAMRPCNDEP
jgi:hypothetical protein